MKNTLFKLGVIFIILFGVSALAQQPGTPSGGGDYTGLSDANTLMATTQGTVSKAIGFAGFIFGWVLLLGFPIGAYYLGYKHFKEKDEQDRSGNANTAMIHVKAGVIAIVALIMGTMIFTFIFVKTLKVSNDTSTAIVNVLKINSAFGNNH